MNEKTKSSVNLNHVPSMEQVVDWITTIYDQGVRRPGYPADEKVEHWLLKQFNDFGLNDITREQINIKKWEASGGILKLWGKDNSQFLEISCFPIPYSRPLDKCKGELIINSKNSSTRGKILVSKMKMTKLPIKNLKVLANVKRYYDPENEFKHLTQNLPTILSLKIELEKAINDGAMAFIGLLYTYPWETDKYYVPYDAVERNIPAVWVSPKNSRKLLEMMDKGPIQCEITYKGKISPSCSHNIIGRLQGNSDEWVIIGTHHDGPWNSAVEDASGIALVLAQAKYWAQIPKVQRPFNMIFVINGAHMAGAKGAQSFIKNYGAILDKTIVAIHLEHVGRDVKSKNRKLIPLDVPTVRWWFVSRILPLEEIVERVIIEEDLKRSLLLPPDGFPPGNERPPTDGSRYHPAGIPLISFLTAPPYLFDPADTLEMIHQESIEPLTRAVIQIINSLKKYSAAELRKLVLSKNE